MTARFVAVLALAGCAAAPPARLQQWGTMREVMREGQAQARVRLRDLDLRPGTVGVGALADLAGEITITGATVHVATAADGAFAGSEDGDMHVASLLTVAEPTRTRTLASAAALDETALESLLRDAGVHDLATLRIDGIAESLDLHVARGACPHGVATPATAPWRWSAAAGTAVHLVGFFAPDRAGVLTHHGTSFHLHAVVRDGARTLSGHLDAFALRPGARVTVGALVP